jgi:nicotinamidase-related amidase
MLDQAQCALVVIDVQGKLARTVSESGKIVENTIKLIKGAYLFNLPVVVTEQNPAGLGPTIDEVKQVFEDVVMVEKMTFNSCLEPSFADAIEKTGRQCILICGIEAHVCVYQTVAGLLERGLKVCVASDAVSSRAAWNRNLAIERMRDLGAEITTTEMALFEFMKDAGDQRFGRFIKIVK